MHIGLYIFATDYAIRIDELAEAAEARGFESLWVTEHTHIPTSRRTPYPRGGEMPREYCHTFDPFVALMAAAAATKKLKIGTGVCLIIERDPIITAKSVASLDVLSKGRLLFGIGAGWNAEEMAHHGTAFESRFRRLEEEVLAMKEIWTKEEAEFHGEFVRFDPIWSWPKPLQKPHPPILLGGAGPRTLRRVVDFCDGWIPLGFSAEAILEGVAELRALAEKAGRSPDTISISVFEASPNRRSLDRYALGGIARAILRVPSLGREDVLPRLDKWAKLIPGSI